MKFEHRYDDKSPKVIMELDNDSTLDQVFEAMEGFLKACTYHFDGQIGLIDEQGKAID